MFVVKASGKKERFDRRKIYKTCKRAGAPDDVAERISEEIERTAYDGITTKEILRRILRLLEKEMPKVAARYDLKGAIMRMGPAGYVFEHLVSELLRAHGYRTKWHIILRGFCVEHEVDVIAEKNGKRIMIECKYHNSPGIYTGIKDALYTYARFVDLKEGGEKFDEVWLVSNTKFSTEAMRFGSCRKMKMVGWNHPKGEGIKDLLEAKRLYPVTVLRSLTPRVLERLSSSGLMFCRDLLKMNENELSTITGLGKKQTRKLIEEAENVVGNSIR